MTNVVRHIACAVSGGVDSAVAALLLKRKGYRITGVFMRNWDLTDETGVCSIDNDYEDAAYVCQHLNIPLVQVNFVKEYWNSVFCKLVQGYQEGLTPNPDVLCNRHIKFDAFHKYATKQLSADAIATGHYARTLRKDDTVFDPDEGVSLLTAVDGWKDQTLFLCQISQAALRQSIFPVGGMMKHEVKQIAKDAGLERIANKKESTGVCFIGKRNFHNFIQEYVEERPGLFIHIETGEVMGEHKGTHYWTRGQRTHIGGKHVAFFVVNTDPKTRQVLVAPGTDHPSLFSHSCTTSDEPHWINHTPEELYSTGQMDCQFRYQHIHPLQPSQVTLDADKRLTVEYERPLRAISPGQYAVFYKGEECLGGAEITSIGPSLYDMDIHSRVTFSKEFR